MSFPRYPKYKDSGVEWLGEVPEHWQVVRLRRVAKFNPSPNENNHLDLEKEVSFVPMDAVSENGEIRLDQRRLFGDVSKGYTYFADGDVIVATITPCFENGKGAIAKGLINGVAFGSTEFTVVRPAQGLSALLLHYWFKAPDFRKRAESSMYGAGGQKRVPDDFFREFTLGLPGSEEQRQIVEFLDRETAKIDALVAEQERLMELLKEKRQAVISHAVTKGLNPNAPMKPSGIDWLGDIPAHWEVVKMKHVARMESGHTPDKKIAAYWENGQIPWVSLNDTGFLKDNSYINETAYNITPLGIENSSAHLLPARAVVFSRDATIGRCAITLRPMAVSQHFIAWICGVKIVPEYLLLRLRSMTKELDSLTTGATLKTIGMPEVRTIATTLPPLAEQKAIIAWATESTATLDQLTIKTQSAIDLLKERRSALISAAVTGQIDVRGLAQKDAA